MFYAPAIQMRQEDFFAASFACEAAIGGTRRARARFSSGRNTTEIFLR
jgi:hypothetical protein